MSSQGTGVGVGVAKPGSLHWDVGGNHEVTWQDVPAQQFVPPVNAQPSDSPTQGVGTGVGEGEGVGEGDGVGLGDGESVIVGVGEGDEVTSGVGVGDGDIMGEDETLNVDEMPHPQETVLPLKTNVFVSSKRPPFPKHEIAPRASVMHIWPSGIDGALDIKTTVAIVTVKRTPPKSKTYSKCPGHERTLSNYAYDQNNAPDVINSSAIFGNVENRKGPNQSNGPRTQAFLTGGFRFERRKQNILKKNGRRMRLFGKNIENGFFNSEHTPPVTTPPSGVVIDRWLRWWETSP